MVCLSAIKSSNATVSVKGFVELVARRLYSFKLAMNFNTDFG